MTKYDVLENGSSDIVIVGAGVAGLSAALHLAERGLKPLVLEADPDYVGGRLAGGDEVEVDGYTFRGEHGVHGIWSGYRNLQAMLARNNIRPTFIPSKEETWIYKDNSGVKKSPIGSAIRQSWLPAPLHYLNMLFRPSFLAMLDIRDWLALPIVWGGLMWGVGIDPMGEGQPLEGLYLDYLVKYWPPKVRAFFVGLARNGLSGSPEEIPLSGFIAFLRFYSLLRRDSWAFSYMPDDGGTSVCEPMADKVRELGGKIVMGMSVQRVEKGQLGWKIICDQDGEEKVVKCSDLILAMDVYNTQKLVESSPDLTTEQEIYWPRGMETAIIRVWFDTGPISWSDSGILTGDFVLHNFFWLHRLYGDYRRWHKETGGSAIEVHVYNPQELKAKSDEELMVRAIADIRSAFPELKGSRIHQVIQRNPVRHTMIEVGPVDRHLSIRSPWENLFLCGDWVNDPTPAFFIERACVTGILAANAVLEKSNNDAWKLLDYPKPEWLAGMIEKMMQSGRRRRRNKK